MDKFCTNCGKKLNLESDYCLNCGKIIVKNRYLKDKKKQFNFEILGIIGLICGLVAFYISFIFATFTNRVLYEINDILVGVDENLILYKLFFAIFYGLLPLLPSVTGLVLSFVSIKKEKNMYSIIGLVSSLISLVFCIGMIVYLIM